jgi:hypothetical protein
MIIITVGSFILSNKKGSDSFEDAIYNESLDNEILLED